MALSSSWPRYGRSADRRPTRRQTSQPETAIIAYSAVHTGPNSQEGGAHDGRRKEAYSVEAPVPASEPIRATAVTAAAKAARPSQRADVDCGGCAVWVVMAFPIPRTGTVEAVPGTVVGMMPPRCFVCGAQHDDVPPGA